MSDTTQPQQQQQQGPKLVQSSYGRKSASAYRAGTSPVISPGLPPPVPSSSYALNNNKEGRSSPSPAGQSPLSVPSSSPELSPSGTSPVESKSFNAYQPVSIPSSNQGTPVTGPQPSPFRVTTTSTNRRYVSTDNMLTPVEGSGVSPNHISPVLAPTSVLLVRQSPPLAPKKAPAPPPPLSEATSAPLSSSTPTAYIPYSSPPSSAATPQNRFAALDKKKTSAQPPRQQQPHQSLAKKQTVIEVMPSGLPDFQKGADASSSSPSPSLLTSNPDAVVAESEAIIKRRAKREATEAMRARRKAAAEKPPTEREEFNSDYSSSSTTAKAVEVPLVRPRYESSYRQSRSMSVSDSQSDTCSSASDLHKKSSHETLKVVNGRNAYTGEMTFNTYAVYKFGKNKIITDSVGYANDGDLLVTREDVQSESEPDSFALQRNSTAITSAVCIDSRARRPMTADEQTTLSRRKQLNLKKHKKYPGIRAPRNKKIINRIQNDSLVTHPIFREILVQRGILSHRVDGKGEALEFIASEETFSTGEDGAADEIHPRQSKRRRGSRKPKGAFEQKRIPKEFMDVMDKDEEVQNAYLERNGISPVIPASMPNFAPNSRHQPPPDPNGPESRFHALNARLKQEIKHALGGSEYLTELAVELEDKFTALIVEAQDAIDLAEDPAAVKRRKHLVKPLEFAFRDGYGRLVCHAVAAFYRLVSTSDNNDSGKRMTFVTFPTSMRARSGALELPNSTLVRHLLKNYKRAKVVAPAPVAVAADAEQDETAAAAAVGMALPTLSLDDYQSETPQLN